MSQYSRMRLVRPVVLVALLASCSRPLEPCSPLAAELVDQSCVEAVSAVLERECPDTTGVADCAPARAVFEACGLLVDEHARRCGG